MDEYHRMIIRAQRDWQVRRRAQGKKLICPGCGETRPHAFELHHIAGAAFDDEVLPLCIVCHREMSSYQDSEHPAWGADRTNPLERDGRFLLGAADLHESIAKRNRALGERMIAAAKDGRREL